MCRANISQIKRGDRVCGILYRVATISSTWCHARPLKNPPSTGQKLTKLAKNKFGQREARTPKRKCGTKRALDTGTRKDIVGPAPLNSSELQAAYFPEKTLSSASQ